MNCQNWFIELLKKSFVKTVLTRTRKKTVWQTAVYGQQETRIQSSLALRTHSHQTIPLNQDYWKSICIILKQLLRQIGVAWQQQPQSAEFKRRTPVRQWKRRKQRKEHRKHPQKRARWQKCDKCSNVTTSFLCGILTQCEGRCFRGSFGLLENKKKKLGSGVASRYSKNEQSKLKFRALNCATLCEGGAVRADPPPPPASSPASCSIQERRRRMRTCALRRWSPNVIFTSNVNRIALKYVILLHWCIWELKCESLKVVTQLNLNFGRNFHCRHFD